MSCEPLYELLGELAATPQAPLLAGKRSAASSYQRFTLRTCFPSSLPAAAAALPVAAGTIPITVRSSPSFSDISQRIWPATFSLVDALLLLSPAIGACAGRHEAADSVDSAVSVPAAAQSWSCIEMGSGTGLAGIALAHAFAGSGGGDGAPSSSCCRCGQETACCLCMRICNVTLTDGCADKGVPLLQANASLPCNALRIAEEPEGDAEGDSEAAAVGTAVQAESEPEGVGGGAASKRSVITAPSVPVCVHHWQWGEETADVASTKATAGVGPTHPPATAAATEATEAAAPSASASRAFLCGSDLVYDPGTTAEMVKALRALLRPRVSGSDEHGKGPLAAAALSWREHLARVLAADDSDSGECSSSAAEAAAASGAPRHDVFPWRACSPTCSGLATGGSGSAASSGPRAAFALLCSTMRNRETYGGFLDGLLAGGLVYYDLTHEVEELRRRRSRRSSSVVPSCGVGGGGSGAGAGAGVPAETPTQRSRICEKTVRHHVESAGVAPPLVPSASHTALLRFSSVWEALLRPRLGGTGGGSDTPHEGGAARSVHVTSAAEHMRHVVGLVLPPLL